MVIRKGDFAWLVPLLLVACAGSSNESGSDGSTQAEPGDAEAQYNLALSYYEGEGGVPDYPAAREWYERAADQGYAPAQFNLALMHYEGEGGPPDYNAARLWYERAAKQGYAPAQFRLALMCYEGEGGPADKSLAYAWLHAAVEQDDEGAVEYRERLGPTSEWIDAASLAEAQRLADQFYQLYVEPFI